MKTYVTILLIFLVYAVNGHAELVKFKIDSVHSAVLFKISHLGFSSTYGRFTAVDGTFVVDEAKAENSSVDIKVKTDSLVTHDEKRDKHLKGPDFFNAKQNPVISFASKTVKKVGDVYKITGDLTLNGVTRSQTIDFKRARTGKDPWGGTRTGGDTTFKIKRSDFKMDFMQGENQIGDEVELIISIEGIRA